MNPASEHDKNLKADKEDVEPLPGTCWGQYDENDPACKSDSLQWACRREKLTRQGVVIIDEERKPLEKCP